MGLKELDSHAKHGQSFKEQFGRITEYFCAKNLTSGFVQIMEIFPIVALADVNDAGTLYMCISPGRVRPCTHRPEQEREQPINGFIRLHCCTGLAREECL